MKSFLQNQTSLLRVTWAIVAGVVLAGVFAIWVPGITQVNETLAQSKSVYDETVANDRTVERAAQLRAIRARVENDVRHLGGQQNEGRVVATALRLFNDEGKRFHVDVRDIVPAASSPETSAPVPAASPGTVPPPDPLVGEPITLGLRGHFRDVVKLLVDLPKHDVLIDVANVQMSALGNDASAEPALNVTVQATIYRIRSLAQSEESHAAGVTR